MRPALLLLLLSAIAEAHSDRCKDQRYTRSRTLPCQRPPVFEFAPASGAGMSAACACTNVTGGHGEAVTIARTSSAYCTKGNELTGIVPGDLVLCGANLPLVMPGGDGSGPMGLLVEQDSTNSVLWPEAFDNVAWTLSNTGTSNPVVTANAALAPNNALTADRVQFPATTLVTDDSLISQPGACTGTGAGNPSNLSVYVRGVSGSGTLDMCVRTNTAAWSCAACAYVSATATRCILENVTITANGDYLIGQATAENGGTLRAANDVYLWGADCERGSGTTRNVTSYIPTTTVAVTRAAATATAPIAMSGRNRSLSLTCVAQALPAATLPSLMSTSAANTFNDASSLALSTTNAVTATFRIASVSSTVSTTTTATANASNRISSSYDGVNKRACLNGTCVLSAASLVLPAVTQVNIGARVGTTFGANRVVKQLCIDNTANGCR